jgi:hypothetical protein
MIRPTIVDDDPAGALDDRQQRQAGTEREVPSQQL